MQRMLILCLTLCALLPALAAVEVTGEQLTIDGVKQPMLFGAELQYFRLRGAYGPNVARARVIELWNKALDRMVEAKMNAISFYIPWDFHEYAEGKFDFTGTVDLDHDGNPDYPSRDLPTFFRLIDEHGIKRIMVRPGPYINAEWGFLGFGAVPEWFHKKFPASHMQAPNGSNTKLYDYHNPDFLEYSRRWFKAVYDNVLKKRIGPGLPIAFLQLDNETNFQWQSLYNADYGPRAKARYQDFLKARYTTLAALNAAHHRAWSSFAQVTPPMRPGGNKAEDQDWYRFQDNSIYTYLQKIRGMWEGLGLREPQVLFTLAESYNAPDNGLLPNYQFRNAPGLTGMMTVNLYPKTFETLERPLHNTPFKADLDVLSADEANNHYLGKKSEWVLGPEVQGGWWRGIDVSSASRQQTYLTTVGHGMKALFIYYFNEGWNWGASLPLQYKLYFDAPLDENANPRGHYDDLRMLGEKVFSPYADFIARSTNVFDRVAIVKDNEMHVPTTVSSINPLWASADWAGGLLGWMLNEGVRPRILFSDMSDATDFARASALFHIDTGMNAPSTVTRLQEALTRGQTVINLLANDVATQLGLAPLVTPGSKDRLSLSYYLDAQGRLSSKGERGAREVLIQSATPLFTYELRADDRCDAILYAGDKVVGYRCPREAGSLIQLGALAFEDFNASTYADISDISARRGFMRALLKEANVKPLLGIDEKAERLAAFARQEPQKNLLWITVKTSTKKAQDVHITVDSSILPKAGSAGYEVTDLIKGDTQTLNAAELSSTGLRVQIASEGSTVFVVKGKN